jgi:hypothetical protein
MDRQARLRQIGDALQAANAAGDWSRLGEHVNALGGQLRLLAARGPWNVAERAALLRLRQTHDAAARNVAGAAQELGKRLEAMRANQEGWVAYAMHSETDDGASREQS